MQKSAQEQLLLETKLSSIFCPLWSVSHLLAACFISECPSPSSLCMEHGYLSLANISIGGVLFSHRWRELIEAKPGSQGAHSLMAEGAEDQQGYIQERGFVNGHQRKREGAGMQ